MLVKVAPGVIIVHNLCCPQLDHATIHILSSIQTVARLIHRLEYFILVWLKWNFKTMSFSYLPLKIPEMWVILDVVVFHSLAN